MSTKGTYHPVMEQGIVFGSVCTYRLNFMLTEVKHLVVHPMFRKMGLGKTLINKAIAKVETPIMYATIRESNIASMHIFNAAGFDIISTAKIKDHNTHFLIKNNATYNETNTASKS